MSSPAHDSADDPLLGNLPRKKLRTFTFPRYGILAIFLLLIVLNIAVRLLILPLNRIIELRYCRQYYSKHDPSVIGRDGSVPENLCKINSVQEKLAFIRSYN